MAENSPFGNGTEETTMIDQALQGLADFAAELPKSSSNSQHAYDAILGAILNRNIQSGQRLAEIPVAKAINVGRTPVREALMRLESDGFVTSEPRVGLVVSRNTLATVAEIYEVREVLESFASRLAARYARQADILSIRNIIDESRELTKEHDTLRLRLLNTRFHEAIHIAAHNDQLRRTLRQLVNRVRLSPVSTYDVPGRAERALSEHEAILDAIVAKDEDLAAHLAAEHLRCDKEARLSKMASTAAAHPFLNEGRPLT